MTTILERAEAFAVAMGDAAGDLTWRHGAEITTYWFDGDILNEGSAWIKANSDILPYEVDASWRQMDNGPLLTLRARNVEDVAVLLAVAYALSDRFGVGVSTYQPARLGTVGVSVERIFINGSRVGGLAVDFSGSARTAVAS